MMFFTALLSVTALFAEKPDLTKQILLDQAGFSCNQIDGKWGAKSARALELYPGKEEDFKHHAYLFRTWTVTEAELESLVYLPADAAEKAKLDSLGYESIAEMYAERGHLSIGALKRLNPQVNFNLITAGVKIKLPDFPLMDDDLDAWPRSRSSRPNRPVAKEVRVSLSRLEITVVGPDGTLLAAFPCSIARDKAKIPPQGVLKVTTTIARPNYTYTPDHTEPGKKVSRHILPPGPNCPVGIAWIGLNLPGYGIHGTPRPDSIGNAESHGCFRLANWNAARLYALVKPGTPVYIDP